MNFLTLVIISSVLLAILLLGMGIKMLFNKKAEFSGGSCQSSPGLTEQGIGCGCGANSCHAASDEGETDKQYLNQVV